MTSPHHDSRSANQPKTESFPASPSESEGSSPGTDAVVDRELDERENGVGDPTSVPANASQAAPGTSEQSPVDQGIPGADLHEKDTRS